MKIELGKLNALPKQVWKKIKFWWNNYPMKYIGHPIYYKVGGWFAEINWYLMKRRAMRAWKYSGMRHHIVPVSNTKCMIINNQWIKWYNRQPGTRAINFKKLIDSAYFSTPVGSRKIYDTHSPKASRFVSWMFPAVVVLMVIYLATAINVYVAIVVIIIASGTGVTYGWIKK